MKKLKHAVVDIVVTVVVVLAAATQWDGARWVLLIYTPLLIVLKLAALAASGSIARLKTGKNAAPRLLLHLLYAINVIALSAAEWWYLAAGWIVIWVLSVFQDRRI